MAELTENTDHAARSSASATRPRPTASPKAPRAVVAAARPTARSVLPADADLRTTDADGNEVFGAALYGDEARGATTASVEASLGLRRPDRGCRPARGRDRPRPRLRRWRRRPHQRQARRPYRPRDRPRHDRRDARPRPRERRRGGRDNVEFLKGHIEDIPLPDDSRRRRHLQLRHQPLRRQAPGHPRGRPRPEARRPVRRVRRDRRPRHGRGHPHRHEPVDRLRRRRPDRATSSRRPSPPPA